MLYIAYSAKKHGVGQRCIVFVRNSQYFYSFLIILFGRFEDFFFSPFPFLDSQHWGRKTQNVAAIFVMVP